MRSTLPYGQSDLRRISAFQDSTIDPAAQMGLVRPGSKLLTTLSPSMLADLGRFESRPGGTEMLEVLASSLRHTQAVTIHLHVGKYAVPLSIFPREHLYHCAVALDQLLGPDRPSPALLRVEPANARAQFFPAPQLRPIRALLWTMALYGPTGALLPEIDGPATYRLTRSLDLNGLSVEDYHDRIVSILLRRSVTLHAMARWPGMSEQSASRLLNAFYLQGALITSRTHPDASRPKWLPAAKTRK